MGDNIEMNLKDIVWEDLDWINLHPANVENIVSS